MRSGLVRARQGAWWRLSLSARILVGLGAGIVTGLFFGEPAAALQPVADIYLRLMQMTVLPYLITSLVVAFGQLSGAEAKRLALRGGAMLLLVWTLTIAVIVILPQVFPRFTSAEFFSQALVEPHQSFSLTDVYFTSNPFEALSRNTVPAVVLFSCLTGIGLMGLRDKEHLLAPLRTWNAAIVNVTGLIIELTPVGVFAIGAVAAGTLTPETFTRLEVYFIAFTAASLLLALWVLPLLVTAVTPFRYAEVAGIARGALLTAFVANNAFIVLPVLVERSKELMASHGLRNARTDSAAEVLVPVLFNFPNAGKLLTLLFIPFAAWLSDAAFSGSDYATLIAAGIPSYFAKAQVALPFLLDLFALPHDLFQLYVPTTIITGKLDSLVTAVNLLVFALLGAGAMGGFLVFDRRRLLRAALGIAAGTAAVAIAVRLLLPLLVDTHYRLDDALRSMHQATRAPQTIVHRPGAALPAEPAAPDATAPDAAAPAPATLARLHERGTLRIGYDPDNLPMSFFNADGELVGFDIELSEQAAVALGLAAEYVPVDWADVPRLLAEGTIDLMPGMWYRPYWFASVRLSAPYFVGTVGFAVRDERRQEFASIEALRRSSGLTIGVPLSATQIEVSMRRYFGDADVRFEVVEFWQPFFEGKLAGLDAFLMPAEHAAAWTLLYPQYSVVVPQPGPVGIPSAFGVAPAATELLDVINEWVVFADSAGTVQQAYDYWILGEGAKQPEPRWSVLRNVLGWID